MVHKKIRPRPGPAPTRKRQAQRIATLAVLTQRRLAALCAAIAPHARRLPHDPVPPVVLDTARPLLADAAKILASEGGALHPLGDAPLWAELDATAQLCLADLSAFDTRQRAAEPGNSHIRELLMQRIRELNRGPLHGSSDSQE